VVKKPTFGSCPVPAQTELHFVSLTLAFYHFAAIFPNANAPFCYCQTTICACHAATPPGQIDQVQIPEFSQLGAAIFILGLLPKRPGGRVAGLHKVH
jgi:hypothetical protein